MDAYIKGRLAGKRYAIARDEDSATAKPANPYSGPSHMESVEWDRGFNDGMSLQRRGESPSASAGQSGDPALLGFFRLLTGLFRRA
jgi:hypothetical protein